MYEITPSLRVVIWNLSKGLPKTLFPVIMNSYIKSLDKAKINRDKDSHTETSGLVTTFTADVHF